VVLQYRELEQESETEILKNPRDIVAYVKGGVEFRPEQEQLWVILLDTRLRALGRHLCALGTVNQVLFHPRDVFRTAILGNAHSIVLVHNHPSGDPEPSEADETVTRQFLTIGEIIGIEVVDHVILGDAKIDPRGVGHWSILTN